MGKLKKPEGKRNLAYYRQAFSELTTYQSKALNKPILLLALIDLMSQGLIEENKILISDESIKTFNKYWELLNQKEKLRNHSFALPFFHLKNDKYKFWHLRFSQEYEGGRPQTILKLREDVDYAYLDNELFELLREPQARKELIDTLVATWFSASQRELEDILEINQDFQDSAQEETEVINQSSEGNKQPRVYLRKSLVRDSFFRKTVVHLYNYRCALCRLKVTHSINQVIVEGAHIKPFSEFYDNQIGNGLSLCKNHHWAFDSGLFTLNDDYRVIVSRDFQEESPNAKPIREFQGENILLPDLEIYYPSRDAIEWHRENKFLV